MNKKEGLIFIFNLTSMKPEQAQISSRLLKLCLTVNIIPFEKSFFYVALAGLELFLPLPSSSWYYNHVPLQVRAMIPGQCNSLLKLFLFSAHWYFACLYVRVRESNTLELELQTDVSCRVGTVS